MKAENHCILFSDYTLPPPPAGAKAACVRAAQGAAKRPARDFTLAGQLRVQLFYISRFYWLALVGQLLLAGALLLYLRSVGQPALPTLVLLCALGPALAATSAPELAKSHTHGMAELEAAAPHSLARLTAIRLLITGLAALPVLCAVLALVQPSLFGAAVVAVTLPFLLASALCYCILGRVRGLAGSLAGVGACGAVALCGTLLLVGAPFAPGPLLLAGAYAGTAALLGLAAYGYIRKSKTERILE